MNCTIFNTQEAQKVVINTTGLTALENVLARLPEGATLKNVVISVDEACAAGTTLSIGISSAKTKFVNAQSVAAIAVAHKSQYYVGAKNGEDIYFTLNQASTIGAITVLIEYYTKNSYVGQY